VTRCAGVFETLRVEGGRALHLEDHLARLRASVRELHGVELGGELEACVAAALRDAGDEPQRLRIVAAPRAAPEATLAPLGPAASSAPVELRPWVVPGGLGAHKWLDRRRIDEASARLGATPLIVEADGEVLEASWGNVFALQGRRLTTPPADGRLLPGVTRARLLGSASELGLEAGEERLSLDRLAQADAVIVTSALRMAVPARLDPGPGADADAFVRRIASGLFDRKSNK
jgi:para-aminobenzoate synthetase / 4-amino-4-deoxychorismate lyase